MTWLGSTRARLRQELTAGAFSRASNSFMPGVALVLFRAWADPFTVSSLSDQEWSRQASALGIGLGTVLSLVIQRITPLTEVAHLKKRTILWTWVFIVLIFGCFLMRRVIPYLPDESHPYLIQVWSLIFIAAITSLCLTLTYASMVTMNGSMVLFWCVVIFGSFLLGLLGWIVARYLWPLQQA
jgi:hypothetical protein